ncbi:MAG: hypothetical protein WAN26_02150, partial [Steroidobacteraceae bacterium]
LYAFGALAAHAAASFGAGARSFNDAPALTDALYAALGEGAADVRLLIKGSRLNRLERVVAALVPGAAAPAGGH